MSRQAASQPPEGDDVVAAVVLKTVEPGIVLLLGFGSVVVPAIVRVIGEEGEGVEGGSGSGSGSGSDVDCNDVVDAGSDVLVTLSVEDAAVVVVIELGLPEPRWKVRMEVRTNAPEEVSWSAAHPPCASDAGWRAAHFSILSLIAQLASEIWFCFKKSSQTWVEAKFTSPLPFALHVPHSVANNGMPFARAVLAFCRIQSL